MNVLKFLQKNPTLQKDKNIWERLEYLLNNSHQNVKKEILKLLSVDDPKTLKYLIDMYDDESADIRHFVFDKISELENFDLIKPSDKLKLLHVGLSDNSQKVLDAAIKFLKKFCISLKIIKTNNEQKRNENSMDIEEEENSDKENENNNQLTVHEKIIKTSSPLKIKKKLFDSPFRLFDHLDASRYYNDPKLSYAFILITSQLIDIIDFENLVDYTKSIVENLITSVMNIRNVNIFSPDKFKRKSFSSNKMSSAKKGTSELFSDVFFLQNLIYFLNSKGFDKNLEPLKTSIMNILPDVKTFTSILDHFYTNNKENSFQIIHQLFLISQYLTFDEEIGNREITTFLKKFLIDYSLENKNILENKFTKKLELFPCMSDQMVNNTDNSHQNSFYDNNNSEEKDDYLGNHISKANLMDIKLENTLLTPNRKIILSLDDLIDYALKILLKIYYKEQLKLSTFVMELISDLQELISSGDSSDNTSELKKNEFQIISNIKEKVFNITTMRENLEKKKDKKNNELITKISKEEKELADLDSILFKVKNEEFSINLRVLRLCIFLIKYCKISTSFFNDMASQIILPVIKKKERMDLVNDAFFAMGLMSVNYYKDFKNYFNLFLDTLKDPNREDFKEFQMRALFVFFDIILQNDLSSDEENSISVIIEKQLDGIIKNYLYHQNQNARLISLLGLCKILIANKITRPEFYLSRMIVVLFKSFEITDSKKEDFHVKVYEIMSSFVFFYVNSGKNYVKSLINSIMIVFLCQIIGENNFVAKTVFTDYLETKLEFINQFLKMICESDQEKKRPRKILFKIFKFVYFLLEFIQEDNEEENSNNISNLEQSVNNINLKKKINETINNSKLDIDKRNTKKYHLSFKILQNIKINLKKFLEKTKFDSQLFCDLSDEISLKFIALLNRTGGLKYFSEETIEKFKEIKNNDFKIEKNGIETDIKNQIENYDNYIENKKDKYNKLINEFLFFHDVIKSENVGTIIVEETSVLIEENYEENNCYSKYSNQFSKVVELDQEENSSNIVLLEKDNNIERNNYNERKKNKKNSEEEKSKNCIYNFLELNQEKQGESKFYSRRSKSPSTHKQEKRKK